jgi:hypothetical protein
MDLAFRADGVNACLSFVTTTVSVQQRNPTDPMFIVNILSVHLLLAATLGRWVYSPFNINECQRQKQFSGSRA